MRNEVLQQIDQLQNEIQEKKKQLSALRETIPPKLMEHYVFEGTNGREIPFLELFGDHDELFVIHNMGKSCVHCTMWADGFNGVYHHLLHQASFVLTSPDSPEVQDSFAAERKWQFPMVSVRNNNFAEDLGFQKGKYKIPGVSTFRKDDQNNIYLHNQSTLGPGDDFCVTWSLYDLLPSGWKGVEVKKKIHTRSDFQLTNYIAIGVKDYEKAVQFYETVFGMKRVQTFENETKLTMSGTNFFFENNEDNNVYFEFAVSDVEASLKLLLDNGCEIIKKFNEQSLLLLDPFGMRFHLFESN